MHLLRALLPVLSCWFAAVACQDSATHRILVNINLQEQSIRVLLTELDENWPDHLAGTTPVQSIQLPQVQQQ
jgi:hypothetical protein